jgi:nucleotide-binding universal stress UspA family protein
MKKILLPTDFSINAQKAIDYAVRLFEKEQCTFYLLHAYHDAPSDSTTRSEMEDDLTKLAKSLEQKSGNPKHVFESILTVETLISAMTVTIIDKAIDYVVMGTKGSSALREVFMGSITASIIKHLNICPVIAVPSEYDHDVPQDIVFANDFKHTFKTPELIPLIGMALLCNCTLNVVHIRTEEALTDTQKLNKELLRTALKGTKHLFFQIDPKNSVTETLYQLEKENKRIGMLALLKTNHGLFKRFLREAVIKNMSIKTEVPLLVLPEIE